MDATAHEDSRKPDSPPQVTARNNKLLISVNIKCWAGVAGANFLTCCLKYTAKSLVSVIHQSKNNFVGEMTRDDSRIRTLTGCYVLLYVYTALGKPPTFVF